MYNLMNEKVTHQIRAFSSKFGHMHLDDYVRLHAYHYLEWKPGRIVIWKDFQVIWKQPLIFDLLSIYSALDSTHWINSVSNDRNGNVDTYFRSSHPGCRHLKLYKMNPTQMSLKRRNVLLYWLNIFSNISHGFVENYIYN